MKCEDYREKELFEEMKKIYDIQKDLIWNYFIITIHLLNASSKPLPHLSK